MPPINATYYLCNAVGSVWLYLANSTQCKPDYVFYNGENNYYDEFNMGSYSLKLEAY